MKFLKILMLLLCAYSYVNAQNPLVTNIYTADPTARVFDGKLYIYPSHDVSGCTAGQGDNNFCMPDYHVFSTNDLVNYTDHGVILDQNQVPWVKKNSFGMWAPDCVKKGDTYYFYFPARPADNKNFRRIGLATSKSPTGPFKVERNSMNLIGIDPGVFVDTDGKAYMYWAQGGNLKGVRLNNNMKQTQGPTVNFSNMPSGYKEGPFTFKRNGIYYFTFPRAGANGYEIDYATGNSPLGPFTFRGVIMPAFARDTNHHSIVQYKGKWYIFYHWWDLSGNTRLRSMRAEEIQFNANGTIKSKTKTDRGIGIPKANDIIQIDRHNGISGARVERTKAPEPRGFQLSFINNNGFARFNRVNFNGRINELRARVASGGKGGTIEFRTGSQNGPLLGKITVPNTNGWNSWRTISANATGNTEGIKDLFCVFKGNGNSLFNVNWVSFTTGGGVINPPNPTPNPNPNPTTGAPIGKTIYLKAHNDNYVSARINENNSPLKANKDKLLLWEKFTVVNAGNGKIALRSLANNQYVSARLNVTNIPLRSERNGTIGIWEQFEWVLQGSGKVALKAHNGSWVSARLDETDNPIRANRVGNNRVGTWEVFSFGTTNAEKNVDELSNVFKANLSNNPLTTTSYLNLTSDSDNGISLELIDIEGKILNQIEFPKANNQSIELPLYGLISGKASGNYFIKITDGVRNEVKKIVIE